MINPNAKGVSYILEAGDPASGAGDPVHQGIYLKVQPSAKWIQGGGQAVRIPLDGNPHPDEGPTEYPAAIAKYLDGVLPTPDVNPADGVEWPVGE